MSNVWRVLSSIVAASLVLAGCTCSQPKPVPDGGTPTYSLGGTVTGLSGSGLVLSDATGGDVAVLGDGAFTFPNTLASGAVFAVTVKAQPTQPNQTCTVQSGTGSMGDADLATVQVTCATDTFTIGGTVAGLSGTGLVLQNNGADDLAVTADGAFTFTTKVASGGAFAVTVKTQPAGPLQACTVSGGTGTVTAGAVTSVTVNCATTTFTVGGTVSGLAGTLVLQNNGGDDLTVNANGTFAFATPVASGAAYAVTVKTQPATPSQTCTVAGGSGTVGAANVDGVAITCTTDTFTIGGTASGLSGTVVLQNNAGDDLTVSANGTFTFASTVASGQTYDVSVKTQPSSPKQTCAVSQGTGTVGAANVTTVVVTCATDTFTIGGAVSGLSGTVVLQDNGGNDLSVTANGAFTFSAPVASGQGYAVTVKTQPSGQVCSVANDTGTVAGAAVTTVAVTCVSQSYTVGGTVSGLVGTVVLQDNGADDKTVTADGAFTFTTSVTFGQPYLVTVKTQPTGMSCAVSGGSGTMGAANVAAITVTCTPKTHTVGGSVTGLVGTLVLQDNGADDKTLTADGAFTFATAVAFGQPYAVTVKTQPSGYTCAVTTGSGTMGAANVTSVVVTCSSQTYTLGGTLTGLSGSVVLQNNAGDDLTLTADGSFSFTTKVVYGQPWEVTVKTPPAGHSCLVTGGTGTMGAGDVTSVSVTCTANTYAVGGAVTGLAGTLILQDNAGDDLSLTSDGTFTFTTKVAWNQPYAVTVKSQPVGHDCQVTSGAGTIGTADVTTVTVTCTALQYTVGGSLTGLSGTVVLQDNAGDDLSLTADGTFTFTTKVAWGQPYAVTVKTQPDAPTSQTCTVALGSGTMGAQDVTTVAVTCVTNTFTVGGTVSGLLGTLVLQNNGADALTLTADGAFTFPVKVASNAAYLVSVKTQPPLPSQQCTVTAGGGTIGNADVSTVVVTCPDASAQIAAIRAAATGTLGSPLSISGALVTYRIPVVGADPGGYVLQASTTGPALLIGDPDAGVLVGDRVSVDVVATAATGSLRYATASTGLVVHSGGNDVTPLFQNVNGAADLVSAVASYETEAITLGGSGSQTRVIGAFGAPGSSGAGHQAAAIATDALDAGIQLRLVDGLAATLGLAPGCTFRLNGTPMWRYTTTAQAAAWTASDLSVTSCPAPTVTPSPADGATGVLDSTTVALTFNQPMVAASLFAQTAQGPCTGSVQLSTDGFATCVGFGSGSPSMSAASDVATWTPSPGLSYGITYQLKVLGSVTTVFNGVALGADKTFSFTTANQGPDCNGVGQGAVVISQVYGAGGTSSSPYNADFIELHNRGNVSVDLTNWTVQYAATTGTSWTRIATLTGTKAVLPAGGYLLVQTGTVGSGAALTPDFTAGTSMAAGAGKVALMKTTTLITSGTSCPSGVDLADLVGYGTGTNCVEGTQPTPTTSSTAAAVRRGGGCQDTNDTAADFALGTPTPHSSGTTASICGCGALDLCVNETGLSTEADYCSLQGVAGNAAGDFNVTLAAGATSPAIYGQLYEGGLTPGSVAGVVSQVGAGPVSVNPETQSGWQWFPTTQNLSCGTCGNNVEFSGTFGMPVSATPGSAWAFTVRYSLDNGATWTYCDTNGAGSNASLTFEVTKLGKATVP